MSGSLPPEHTPLRIAHFALGRTNPEAADGIDRTVYHLSRSLAELGHRVRLFSVTNKPGIPIPGVTVSTYPSLHPPAILLTRRLRNLFAWRSPLNLPASLVRDLLAWEPDILHLHGVHIPQHLRLAARARRAGLSYCVTAHGMLSGGARSRHRWTKRVGALWERPFLDRAAFLHAVSEQEAADFRSCGLRTAVVVAPNGIVAGDYPAPGSPGPEGSGVGPDLDPLSFTFLGRLDPEQKGLDLLLDGFARSGLDRARMALIGPEWRGSRRSLEALARRLGVSDRVDFIGPAFGQRKLDLLTHSTAFVHTSRWEGLSFSVLEACCLGKTCLLTRAADPREMLGAAGAAVVVEPSGPAIASGLQRIARMSPVERRAMGARARALVERDFGWLPTARVLADAYRGHARRLRPS